MDPGSVMSNTTSLRPTSALFFSMDAKTEGDLAEAHFCPLLLRGCQDGGLPYGGLLQSPSSLWVPRRRMTLLRPTSVFFFSIDAKTEDDLVEVHFRPLLLYGCQDGGRPC